MKKKKKRILENQYGAEARCGAVVKCAEPQESDVGIEIVITIKYIL